MRKSRSEATLWQLVESLRSGRSGRSRRQTCKAAEKQVVLEDLEDRMLLSAVIEKPQFRLFPPTGIHTSAASAGISGLTPSQLRNAYGIDQVSFGSVSGDGTGQTIAIVDAYNAPNLVADLATFDKQFGLLDPPSLTKIGQSGSSSLPGTDPAGPGNSWALETSLDVEWAHAIAPKANILVVEANSDSDTDLFKAVDTARRQAGVSVVSMSWGGSESASQSAYDSYFTTPAGHIGVTFLAASGDSGAYDASTGRVGVDYPASSPNVLSVGGTSLLVDGAGNYISESGWGNGNRSTSQGGSGGGLSRYESQPAYQQGVVTQSHSARAVPDVSMDADPGSGVAVVDSWDFGNSAWGQVGGTSLAAPIWAGIVALVDQGRLLAGSGTLDGATQTLPKLYSLSSQDFHDITSGNNGYSAGAGYDLVTGLGTPVANLLVGDLVSDQPNPNPPPTPPPPTPQPSQPTIGSVLASPSTVTVGTPITLTATNVAEASGTITQVAFYREVMPANGPQPIVDHLIGYGAQQGSSWSITADTTSTAPGTYTIYAIATDSAGNASSPVSTTVTVQAAPQATAPTIGSLKVSPSPVTVGTPVTLTAMNVTFSAGTSGYVAFYRETNPSQGAQPASDHFIGWGIRQGNNWWITADTRGTAPGTYVVYAVAMTRSGLSSSPATASVAVVAKPKPAAPTIGSLQVSSASVAVGTPVLLTAANVTFPAGVYASVAFYRELNPANGPQPKTDHLIGFGIRRGNNWSILVDTRTAAAGTYSLYAIASDSAGDSSAPATASLTITAKAAPTRAGKHASASAIAASSAISSAANLKPSASPFARTTTSIAELLMILAGKNAVWMSRK